MQLQTKRKKYVKNAVLAVLVLFVLMNVIACLHAYKFTHFSRAKTVKTKDTQHLSIGDKISIILTGIDNPRPENKSVPNVAFTTVVIKSNKNIECWWIRAKEKKGTVILFHGYSGQKSTMLDKASIFLKLGYNVLMVDLMGSGGSDGDQTTIGFYEAQEVRSAYTYIHNTAKRISYFLAPQWAPPRS